MNNYPPSKHLALVKSALRPAFHVFRGACKSVINHFSNFIDPPVIILIYHRVTNLARDTEMLAVSPDNFRDQVKFLKQNYRILRFEEDWSGLKEKAVVITFDDGYADNALEALPILEEIGVPATFFICTGNIGTKKLFWWDQLEAILLEDREFPFNFKLDDPCYGQKNWDTDTFQKRKLLYEALNKSMKNISPNRREAWLNQLRQWAGISETVDNFHRSMTHDELVRLSSSPCATIGAHTVTHTSLPVLDEKGQRDEIISSKQELERITNKEIKVFAYPYGGKDDFNQTSARLCREAGIIKTVTSVRGQVHRWSNPLLLPRQLVS